MHMNCYVCEEDSCQAHFAIESLSDHRDPSCPLCGSIDVTDTSEVIVDPNVIGRSVAERKGLI